MTEAYSFCELFCRFENVYGTEKRAREVMGKGEWKEKEIRNEERKGWKMEKGGPKRRRMEKGKRRGWGRNERQRSGRRSLCLIAGRPEGNKGAPLHNWFSLFYCVSLSLFEHQQRTPEYISKSSCESHYQWWRLKSWHPENESNHVCCIAKK